MIKYFLNCLLFIFILNVLTLEYQRVIIDNIHKKYEFLAGVLILHRRMGFSSVAIYIIYGSNGKMIKFTNSNRKCIIDEYIHIKEDINEKHT